MFETEIETSKGVQLWHTVKPFDYVTALVETRCGQIALVQQLRAVGAMLTTEFPGGLLEKNESPEACIRREIREEVGLEAGSITFLAEMIPDTGRLENRLYAVYVKDCEFIDCFRNYVLQGKLISAINIAILGQALIQGHFQI